jgi:hypothetical protein
MRETGPVMSWAGDERKRRSEALERLGLRDASLWLGPPEGFPLARELGMKELLGEMGAYRIGGGLLSHWWGKTISAQAGNGALKALATDAAPGLFTLWTALPLYPVDSGPLPGFGKPDERMKGARLFPKSHNYPLEDWVVGPLCEWLIRYRLPLFLWHTETEWSTVHSLAGRYPRLRVVVESQVKKVIYHTRALFPLMRERPNVSIEISNFVGPGYIEHAVREFGARRLLFGSFMPVNDPLVAAGMLLDAEIGDDDRKMIASGNLNEIIEEAGH